MATSTATVLIPGTVVHQRYVIQEVRQYHDQYRRYLALDSAERFCLLTEFPLHNNDSALNLRLKTLFEQKTAPLLALNHPQLPRFTAAFQEQDGFFLVQEPPQGIPYRQFLKLRSDQGKTMTEPEVIHLLTHLLPALHELHARKLIHCKLSPDSIVLPVPRPNSEDALRAAVRHEVPMLVELGAVDSLARQLSALQTQRSPSDMAPIARLGYAPPEQVQTGRIYPHSDLYGLAVTCLELLTGQPPQKLLDSHTLTWSWQPYTSLSQPFEAVLEQMLSWQPGDRYATAQDVLKTLKARQSSFEVGSGKQLGANRSKADFAALSAGSILSMESWTIDSFIGPRRKRAQDLAAARRETRLNRDSQACSTVRPQKKTSGGQLLGRSENAVAKTRRSCSRLSSTSLQTSTSTAAGQAMAATDSVSAQSAPTQSSAPQWQAWLLLSLLSGGIFASALLIAPGSRSLLNAVVPQAKSPWELAAWIQSRLPEQLQSPASQSPSRASEASSAESPTELLPLPDTAQVNSAIQTAELLSSDIPIPLYLSAIRPEQTLEGSLLILPSQTYFLVGQPGQRLTARLSGDGLELAVLDGELRPLDGDASSTTEWEGELIGGDRTLLRVSGKGSYQLQLSLD